MPMTTIARRFASLVPAAVVAAAFSCEAFAPSVAHADERSRVETIAAKGNISPVVPVEAGLGLGLCAAVLALGMERRARR